MSTDIVADPVPNADNPDTDAVEVTEVPWSRLNPLMLAVHPLRELIRFLPVLLIALVAGSATGEHWWTIALSALGVAIGLAQWFTTRYRITESHVELRRGILNKQALSVPRDRIRSVDVDSTVLHRIFGLSVVKLGTGASQGNDGLELNGVSTKDVPALRQELLRRVAGAAPLPAIDGQTTETTAEPTRPVNLSGWRPAWTRYAPFTFSGLATIVAVAAFLLQFQFLDGLFTRLPWVTDAVGQVARFPIVEIVVVGFVLLLVTMSVVGTVKYLLTNWNFQLSRSTEATLHVSRGLLRTRQVTIDERRLRGVTYSDPLFLRLVGGAQAAAIMTGLGRQRGGLALIEPAGPAQDALRMSAAVLDTAEPFTVPLIQHGPRAHRRRYTRAAFGVGVLAALALVLQVLGYVGFEVWLPFVAIVPFAAFLARDRWRSLGHALLPGWLVTRSGSLLRSTVALETDGIIGWTIRRSFFQRRAGLATLIATTAAGRHHYDIPDLPFDEVWPIIERISGGEAEVRRG
jgi:putative membrane protein